MSEYDAQNEHNARNGKPARNHDHEYMVPAELLPPYISIYPSPEMLLTIGRRIAKTAPPP